MRLIAALTIGLTLWTGDGLVIADVPDRDNAPQNPPKKAGSSPLTSEPVLIAVGPGSAGLSKPMPVLWLERQADVIAIGTMGALTQHNDKRVIQIEITEILKGPLPGPKRVVTPDARLWFGCIMPAERPELSKRFPPKTRILVMLVHNTTGWRVSQMTRTDNDGVARTRGYCVMWQAAQKNDGAHYDKLLAAMRPYDNSWYGLAYNPSPAAGAALKRLLARTPADTKIANPEHGRGFTTQVSTMVEQIITLWVQDSAPNVASALATAPLSATNKSAIKIKAKWLRTHKREKIADELDALLQR